MRFSKPSPAWLEKGRLFPSAQTRRAPRSISSGGPAWAGPAMTATRAAAAQRPVVPPTARMADITASLAQRPPAGPSIGLLRGRGLHGPRPPTTDIALLARAQIVPQILQMAHDP